MLKQEHKVIALSIVAGLVYWALDALGDKLFIFPQEDFFDLLIHDAPTHKFFIRPLVALVFLVLGLIASRYISKARQSTGRYLQLFDSLNDMAFVMPYRAAGRLERFVEANPAACLQLGYSREELLQLTPRELLAPEDRGRAQGLLEKLAADKSLLFEVTLERKDGSRFPAEVNAHLGELEHQPSILALVRDLTARKRSEAEIRRLASFPQLSPNPILEVNSQGEITFHNAATTETLKDLGVGDPRVFLPADLEQILADAREKGTVQFQREIEIKGRVFSELIHFPRQFEVLRIFPLDVTSRKKGEEALRESEQRLRFLASQLLRAQEAERLRISRELHDELGQALQFAKFQMSYLKDRLRRDQQGLINDIGSLLAYLDGVIENVRRLSRDLSPTVLDELGLTSALRYLLEQFGKLHRIECTAELDDIDKLFPARTQLNIYRIFQECLTNIGRHAQATRLAVAVKKNHGQVSFVVQDDGKGFDPEEFRAREPAARGIGVATMAERVQMLRGSLEVQSRKGEGTRVTFSVPVQVEQ